MIKLIKGTTMARTLALAIITATLPAFAAFPQGAFSHGASAHGAKSVTLQMSAPTAMDATDFDADYTLLVNGESYSTVGCPFLYQDYTYFPIRDLSDIYGFEVQYNEKDYTVILTAKDTLIALAPKLSYYSSGSLIRTKGQDSVTDPTGYLNANDRSYIPLRLVSELFDFQVDYDTENHTISISGQTVEAGNIGPDNPGSKVGEAADHGNVETGGMATGSTAADSGNAESGSTETGNANTNTEANSATTGNAETSATHIETGNASAENEDIKVAGGSEADKASMGAENAKNSGTSAFFSPDHQLVIDALAAYEAANTLAFSGIIDFFGETVQIQAALNRKADSTALMRTIYVDEPDDDQFKGVTTVTTVRGIQKALYKKEKNGAETLVNLTPFAGLHPYNELDMLNLCGLTKYSDLQVEPLGSALAGPQYKVTAADSDAVFILTILNGKLVGYKEERGGVIVKELTVSYGS